MKTFVVRPELMFVGQVHGKKVSLPPQIKAATEKYGAWYEGDGGDKIQGVSYKGSWDDAAAKDIKGYPKHFLFVLFTNTAINEQKKILAGDGAIFDRILKTQDNFDYFSNKRFDADTLTSFLEEMGNDYLKLSRAQATKENVTRFIDKGERAMWESGDTPAKKMADKANNYRDMWLLSQPKGVYFVGSDHIKDLEDLFKHKGSGIQKAAPFAKNTKFI
jgi:hypothetical protein